MRKSESKLSASELKKTTNTVLYNEVDEHEPLERDEGQEDIEDIEDIRPT